MVGVVVGGRPAVRVGQLVLVMPGPHDQRVAHHQPPGGRGPAGLQHHGPGKVAAGRRDGHALRAEPEAARRPVQHRTEHARRVDPRQAQPFHVPGGRDQRGGLAVRQEAVLADRRERGFLRHQVRRPQGRHVQAVPCRAGHVAPEALTESAHPPGIPRDEQPGCRFPRRHPAMPGISGARSTQREAGPLTASPGPGGQPGRRYPSRRATYRSADRRTAAGPSAKTTRPHQPP